MPSPSHDIQAVRFEPLVPPDFGNPNNPSETTQEFAEFIEGLHRGELVLAAAEYACFASGPEPGATFLEDPALKAGREASKQGVFFGNLKVSNPTLPAVEGTIAVKPYDSRTNAQLYPSPALTLAHEWGINNYLNSLSTGSAYTPVGLWRTDEEHIVPQLVTNFHRRSTSLDNMFRDDSQNEPVTPGRASRGLEMGNFGIGVAHGARILHNDALPQNFATDGSRLIFNDTTTLRRMSRKKDDTFRKEGKDIFDFYRGTMDIGMVSEQVADLVATILEDPDLRQKTYEKYVHGAQIGASRAGFDSVGQILTPAEHLRMVQRVLDSYHRGMLVEFQKA